MSLPNPPTQLPAVIAGTACIQTVVTLAVFLKIFTKLWIVKKLHIEDYLSVLAWALLVCYNGVILYPEVVYGTSRHIWNVPFTSISEALYWANVAFMIYGPTAAVAKLAVLFQIKRIFTTTRKDTFFYVIWASIILNACFYFTIFFIYTFQCWPREAIWLAANGHCMDMNMINFSTGIPNLISDLQALLLPAWAIWHLKIKVKAKLSIFAVFAVGTIALAVGGVGMWLRVVLLTNFDLSWYATQLAMLAIAEIAIVIVVGCMPVYPRLFRWLKQKVHGTTTEHSQQTDGLRQGIATTLPYKHSRRTGKSDLDTDILVTQTQEFDHGSIENGLELAEYNVRVYNGSFKP